MEEHRAMAAVNNFFNSFGNLPEINASVALIFKFHAHFNVLKRQVFLSLIDQDDATKTVARLEKEKTDLEVRLREANAFIAVMDQPEERYEQLEGERKVVCAVCYRTYNGFVRPVVGVCGHSICRSCKVSLVGNKNCPICRDRASFYYAERNYLAEELLAVLHPEDMLLEEETIPEKEEEEDESDGESYLSRRTEEEEEDDDLISISSEEEISIEVHSSLLTLRSMPIRDLVSILNETVPSGQMTESRYELEHMVQIEDEFFTQNDRDHILNQNEEDGGAVPDLVDGEDDVPSVFEADELDTLSHTGSQFSDDAGTHHSYYDEEDSLPGDAMSGLEDYDYVNEAYDMARQWLKVYNDHGGADRGEQSALEHLPTERSSMDEQDAPEENEVDNAVEHEDNAADVLSDDEIDALIAGCASDLARHWTGVFTGQDDGGE